MTSLLYGPGVISWTSNSSATLGSHALNDSDNSVAWIISLPKSGSLTRIGCLVTAENGTSPAFNCGLVTLDSSGSPTTSAYGGSAITSATWTSTGWKWVTLSTPATAVAGQFAAVRIYPGGSPPDGSNNVSICNGTAMLLGNTASFAAVSWSFASSVSGPFAIEYSDGTVYGLALASAVNAILVRQNTTPDEVGDLLTIPMDCECTGARFFHVAALAGALATLDVVLYDSGGSVVASCSISDKDLIDNTIYVDAYWDSVSLTAGSQYRLVVKPTVGTSGDVQVTKWTFNSATERAYVPCGDWQYTSRTDGGGFSEDSAALCPMCLWLAVDLTPPSTAHEYAFVG